MKELLVSFQVNKEHLISEFGFLICCLIILSGQVYKVTLSNNQPVAIKHIINDANVETFVREVASLSHIRHPNLVALLGYCLSEDEGFLIYELCPNGSLSKWLFGINLS